MPLTQGSRKNLAAPRRREAQLPVRGASRSYLEVRFEIAGSWFDLLSASLQETGCLGLEYRDGSTPGRLKILAYFQSESSSGSVLERLLPWLKVYGAEAHVECDPVADQDWNGLWRSTYRPVEISSRLVVLPAWSRASYPGHLRLRIKPEQAFGTGSHETTRLCLEALDACPLRGRTVADVGTGSGILAIAAALLGAGSVFACDPDPTAILNARHNVRLNRVGACVELAEGELSTLPVARFDVVVANLVLEPLKDGMRPLALSCRKRADVYLSGLLSGQEQELLPLALREGLETVSIRTANDWVLLHLRAGTRHGGGPESAR